MIAGLTIGSVLLGIALLFIVILYLARPFIVPEDEAARLDREEVDGLVLRRDALLRQIRDLDDDMEAAKVAPELYQRNRPQLVRQAAVIMHNWTPTATPTPRLMPPRPLRQGWGEGLPPRPTLTRKWRPPSAACARRKRWTATSRPLCAPPGPRPRPRRRPRRPHPSLSALAVAAASRLTTAFAPSVATPLPRSRPRRTLKVLSADRGQIEEEAHARDAKTVKSAKKNKPCFAWRSLPPWREPL